MKFDNDIFISYAHLDNQPLIKDSEGWVSQFHRALEVRVDQLMGKKSRFWRDPKLQGNDFFDDTIVEQLPSFAVLVSVFTPRYVHSESCKKELTEFCLASQGNHGLRVRDKNRIFKVLKTPVATEQQPEPVRDCLGYEFYKVDPINGRIRELNQVFGDDAEREFWIKLDDLAQDLCQLLGWLEYGAPEDDDREPVAAADSTVFIADCSSDLRDYRDAVKRDLLGHQVQVLPSTSLPLHAGELAPALSAALNESCVSVHMIGQSYGIVPEGTDRSLVELQNELAIEREEQRDFSRIVWIPPGLDVTDARQQRFIDRLRSDPRTGSGADLLEVPFEDLKTQVHQTLKSMQRPAPEVAAPAADEPVEVKSIYLICDNKDSENAAPVADFLFEQGYDVVLPAFQGDEADVRADHEENLRTADGVLIYFGSSNDLWLRGKLRESRKSAGQGRERELAAKAVLIAPPNSEREGWLRMHDTVVIRQSGSFSSNLLDPFLDELRT